MEAKVSAITNFIETIYRDRAVTGADGISYNLAGLSLTPERGQFLHDLCKDEAARTVLEIGMAWGLSTLFLLKALVVNGACDGAQVVIDPFQTDAFHGAALASLRRLGLEALVEFREEFSELALPKMVEARRQFDFIFIDGNHRFDGVFVDLVFADRLLRPGGVVALDDTWSDSIFLACRFLETNFGYTLLATCPPERPGRKNARPFRGMMRAYRKPTEERVRRRFDVVPFHYGVDFDSVQERRLRDAGMKALRAGDYREARSLLKAALQMKPRTKTCWRLLRTYLPLRPRIARNGRIA